MYVCDNMIDISFSVTPSTFQHMIFIGLVGRVFANGLEDRDSIPAQVIPKTEKMVLDSSLLNTQHYNNSKMEQSSERSGALRNKLV